MKIEGKTETKNIDLKIEVKEELNNQPQDKVHSQSIEDEEKNTEFKKYDEENIGVRNFLEEDQSKESEIISSHSYRRDKRRNNKKESCENLKSQTNPNFSFTTPKGKVVSIQFKENPVESK